MVGATEAHRVTVHLGGKCSVGHSLFGIVVVTMDLDPLPLWSVFDPPPAQALRVQLGNLADLKRIGWSYD